MIGPHEDFMDYINMDLWNWTIKEDAPEWAKKEFEEYMKEKEQDNIE